MTPSEAMAITIVAPGLLTTVQDTGRWGHQHYGVSVSGAMDVVSLHGANRLVGNPLTAAALEVTLVGPTLRFERDTRIAVCGAAFDLRLGDHQVSLDTLIHAGSGQMLTFGRRMSGARAYLAAAGGIDLTPVLGSRSTHIPSRMGGLEGRALTAGDTLTLGAAHGAPVRPTPDAKWKRRPGGWWRAGARVTGSASRLVRRGCRRAASTDALHGESSVGSDGVPSCRRSARATPGPASTLPGSPDRSAASAAVGWHHRRHG